MTVEEVSDHAISFGRGAGLVVAGVGVVAIGVLAADPAATAATAAPAVAAIVGGLLAHDAAASFGNVYEPRSAIAGALTSVAAIAFAAWHFGGLPAVLPAAPVATAPATTGDRRNMQGRSDQGHRHGWPPY